MNRSFKARIATGSLSLLLTVFLIASPAGAAGGLDSTFDGDGKVFTDFGSDEGAADAALQDDGKIVVVGFNHVAGNNYDFTVARYNPDGSLDLTFDGDGKVVTDFYRDSPAIPEAVAIQDDGKIVVAGRVYTSFALVRYNPDGSLDSTFHGDGKRALNFGIALDVAIQANGKIVAGGLHIGETPNGAGNHDFALVRFTPRGYLDPSFDGDGKVATDWGRSESVTAIAIQDDGRIVAGGATDSVRRNDDFALARHNLDGSLDTSFSFDGKRVTEFNSRDGISSIAIQPNGRIVAAGTTFRPGGHDFAIARYTPNGNTDSSFDGDGKLTTDFGGYDRPDDVAVQADGKIVAAGGGYAGGVGDFALARYGADGSLDPTFDVDGKLLTDLGGSDAASALAIQADGKIVAAGSSNAGGTYDFAVVRLLGGG